MSKKELARILPAADIGLVSIGKMPHAQFNSANKLFDYFACGLSVLLNYGGWQKEVLDEYNAGFGCSNFDDEFVKHLLKLLENPALRKEVGQNSQKIAEDKYNRDIVSRKVLDFIANSISRKEKK